MAEPKGSSKGESTASLIARAKAGDRAALNDVFARCLPPLRRWASGRLPPFARSGTDTLDIVQDVVLQTMKQIQTFRAEREGALQAYLRSAILNRVRDEMRRAGRRPAPAELPGDLPASDASPLDLAIGRQAVDNYERALARLHPIEREAIIARIELGYSYEQMADALGRPSPDAARVALRRALVRLADEMSREA